MTNKKDLVGLKRNPNDVQLVRSFENYYGSKMCSVANGYQLLNDQSLEVIRHFSQTVKLTYPGPRNPHAHGFGQTGRWQTQPMGSLKKKLYYLNGVVLSGTTFNRGFSLAPAFKTV